MKNLIVVSVFFFVSSLAIAQQTRDVVYLKNDAIIKGTIIEHDLTETGRIKIQTADGSVLVYPSSEVLKIVKETIPEPLAKYAEEEINLDDYGGRFSYGPALGGGGLIGLPVQFRPSRMTALELGLYYRPIILDNGDNSISVEGSLAMAGGFLFYLGREYKSNKKKVKMNGISLKAGYSYGNFSQTFGAIGWVSEGFRKNSTLRSFIFELGLGAIASNFNNYNYLEPDTQALIYWKVNWAFHEK